MALPEPRLTESSTRTASRSCRSKWRARVETLAGIGPFYADLILVRATGIADALPREEPRILGYVGHYYDLGGPATMPQLAEIAERWAPFRTWAVVLIRVAGDRAGLPFEKRGRMA